MSIAIWVMTGIAVWHFTVLLPDHFWGGIIGAFLVAVAGAVLGGYLLPSPGLPTANPPGAAQALYALPGSLIALAASYGWGRRHPLDVG